jgi:serine/threonine-protein kinase RsbW
MAVDPPREPTRSSGDRNGWVNQEWSEPAGTTDSPIVDLGFDSDGLATLRVQLRACALQAGFPEDRVVDVVLAVHELAANAVRHGGGRGRLRVWSHAGALQCQVDNGTVPGSAEPEADHGEIAAAEPESTPNRSLMNSLPCEPGHGLWVVQQVADRMRSLSGPRGTSVMIRFDYGC